MFVHPAVATCAHKAALVEQQSFNVNVRKRFMLPFIAGRLSGFVDTRCTEEKGSK